MPTGAEYRTRLLALHQALGQWSETDSMMRRAQPSEPRWSEMHRAHIIACDTLQAAYVAVLEYVLTDLEQQWGRGTASGQG